MRNALINIGAFRLVVVAWWFYGWRTHVPIARSPQATAARERGLITLAAVHMRSSAIHAWAKEEGLDATERLRPPSR